MTQKQIDELALKYKQLHGPGILVIEGDKARWVRSTELDELITDPTERTLVLEKIRRTERMRSAYVTLQSGRYHTRVPDIDEFIVLPVFGKSAPR